MKALFSEKDRHKILRQIHDAMGDRKLSEIVSFDLKPNALEITISKLGTSTLIFSENETPQGLEYVLVQEKIAFTHRPMKTEVAAKIIDVISRAGGKITGNIS